MEVEAATPHTFELPPSAAAFYLDLKSTVLDARSALLDLDRPAFGSAGNDSPCRARFEPATIGSPRCDKSESNAALRLQKVYRSYRTRRRLADSAVVVEELWWQAIDYARLNHSTISFFNYLKPETATSRWTRVSLNAAKVGKGLSKDAKALKLAFQHWIEAIDPRHRYGHNLHFYYEEWCKSEAGQPFFYWLDIGDGKNVDLKECSRALLREQIIQYLGPQEREHFEFVPIEGKLAHKQTGELLDTTKGSPKAKWIFVMSTAKRLYAGQKNRGKFQHSSFLAGGATLAAGRLVAENGVIKSIWAYSGHYRPSEENLTNFQNFLRENRINIDKDQIRSSSTEDNYEDPRPVQGEKMAEVLTGSRPPQLQIPVGKVEELCLEPTEVAHQAVSAQAGEVRDSYYQRTSSGRLLSGGLQSPRANVPRNSISKRINSKKEARSYQLGHQLSMKWSTGAGPRIGCIADYPVELRVQALEFVNLSPRVPPTPPTSRRLHSCMTPNGSSASPSPGHPAANPSSASVSIDA